MLQAQQEGPTGGSHSMGMPSMLCLLAVREESSVQALLRVVENAPHELGGESKDIWAGVGCGCSQCCSDRHTSVFGNPECVTKGRTRVAVECRLTFTCCILFCRKMQRCTRGALVRICTPMSTSHMASLTGLTGTTFQVMNTLNLLHCLSSS